MKAEKPFVQWLWVPGFFWTTNEAYRQMRLLAPERSPAEAAAELRALARVLAKAAKLTTVDYAQVWFAWWGTGREDPDAWTWAGKHVLDGVSDAKVVPSDRKNVYSVGGRCMQSRKEMQFHRDAAKEGGARNIDCGVSEGILVTLAEAPDVRVFA